MCVCFLLSFLPSSLPLNMAELWGYLFMFMLLCVCLSAFCFAEKLINFKKQLEKKKNLCFS